QPTILFDYPIELSPFAKRHRSREGLVERFEAFARGIELANAFTELNDPGEQQDRMRALAEAFPGEFEGYDPAFIEALEYGMPPTGGIGVGIDRLVMVLTGRASIREVVLFPAMREEGECAGGAGGVGLFTRLPGRVGGLRLGPLALPLDAPPQLDQQVQQQQHHHAHDLEHVDGDNQHPLIHSGPSVRRISGNSHFEGDQRVTLTAQRAAGLGPRYRALSRTLVSPWIVSIP